MFENLSRQNIIDAAKTEIDQLETASHTYDVLIGGKRYCPPAVIRKARFLFLGHSIEDVKGNKNTRTDKSIDVLKSLGFEIVPKHSDAWEAFLYNYKRVFETICEPKIIESFDQTLMAFAQVQSEFLERLDELDDEPVTWKIHLKSFMSNLKNNY